MNASEAWEITQKSENRARVNKELEDLFEAIRYSASQGSTAIYYPQYKLYNQNHHFRRALSRGDLKGDAIELFVGELTNLGYCVLRSGNKRDELSISWHSTNNK